MKRDILRTGAKIAATLCVVAGCGFAVVTFSSRGGEIAVQEAEADIWGLSFAEQTKHERFTGVLKGMGMETPRAYDWNGNRVFFSTMTTTDSPRAVLRKFQNEFAAKGVNENAHYSVPKMENVQELIPRLRDATDREAGLYAEDLDEHFQWQNDLWGGGVVPLKVTENFVQMVGATTEAGEKASAIDTVKHFVENGKNFTDATKAMRYVDAFRETPTRTRVTSVWSDTELDTGKFSNDQKFEDKTYDAAEIPTCIGCERKMRFRGMGEEQGYAANIYEGTRDPESMLDYYHVALTNRGWQRSDSSAIMEQAREIGLMPADAGQMHVYSRGKEFITVTAQPSRDNSTLVQVMEMP